MKRALSMMLIGAAAAAAILYGLRLAERASNVSVGSLLPRSTIAFAHLPDLNKTIDQWHHSDIYRIYLEPSVQEFLQKPTSRAGKAKLISFNFHEVEELDPRNTFVALTSTENDKPKIIAGFHFRCSQDVADRVVEGWRSKINPSAKREKVTYQQHEIEVFRQSSFLLAWVQSHSWVFASNDLEELKALVDRADGRVKDPQLLLGTDESFREAMSAMPAAYALLFYLQPKTFADRIAAVRGALSAPNGAGQETVLGQIHSVCATTRFDNGKMHDVIFVGMPKQEQNSNLTRSSLALGTRATFLYAASLLNFSKQLAALPPTGNFMGAGAQKFAHALSAAGITTDDWNLAFGSEIGFVVDWPQETHWPFAIISSAVKDLARAKKIITVLAHGIDEDGQWRETDRDGVHYWSMTTTPSLISLRPIIALSNRVCVAGIESASVEAAVRRSENPSELAASDAYKRAARSVPDPTNFFSYVDPGLLYSRLDATLRPMLLMSAAFLPAVNEYVDVTKLPQAEVITRHLSPIVCSQHYSGRGYVAESIGPITLNQSGIGIGLLAGLGALGYQHGLGAGLKGLGGFGPIPFGSGTSSLPSASATPHPTP
jgi:hypothetical protein